MDPTTASFKRFWQPSYLQTIGLSLFAGAVVTAITHPIEYIKTIIQYRAEGVGIRGYKAFYQGSNPHKVFRQMHALGGGMSGLYQGFQANLFSRLGYLAIRNTLYKIIYDQSKPAKATNDLTSREKAVIGGIAGGIAAYFTTPLTIVSIRQMIDTQINKESRRNYNSVSAGISAIKSQSTNRAAFANVIRHIALNASLTGPFDTIHEALYIRFGDFDFVKPTSIFLASIVSAAITLPFDNVRTRLMNVQADLSKNRLNYYNYFDTFGNVFLHERNMRSLYAGYFTWVFYTYVYATLTIGITETFTDSWKRKAGLIEWQI